MKWLPHILILLGLIFCGIAAAHGVVNGLTLLGFILFAIGGVWLIFRHEEA